MSAQCQRDADKHITTCAEGNVTVLWGGGRVFKGTYDETQKILRKFKIGRHCGLEGTELKGVLRNAYDMS